MLANVEQGKNPDRALSITVNEAVIALDNQFPGTWELPWAANCRKPCNPFGARLKKIVNSDGSGRVVTSDEFGNRESIL